MKNIALGAAAVSKQIR